MDEPRYRLPAKDAGRVCLSRTSLTSSASSCESRTSSATSDVTSNASSDECLVVEDLEKEEASVKFAEIPNRSVRLSKKRRRIKQRVSRESGLQPIEESAELQTHTTDAPQTTATAHALFFPTLPSKGAGRARLRTLRSKSNARPSQSVGMDTMTGIKVCGSKYDVSKSATGADITCKSAPAQTEDPDTGTGNPSPWLRRSHAQGRRRSRDAKSGDAVGGGTGHGKGRMGLKFDHIFKAHIFNLHDATLLRHSQDAKQTPRSEREVDDDDTGDAGENLPQLSGRPEPKPLSSVWRTLPMPSELETYINRLHKCNGRSVSFSRSLHVPLLGNVGGPINRPHTSRQPLMAKQKTRFGTQMLKQTMDETHAGTLTQTLYKQQGRTYDLHTRLKTILQDGIIKHS